MVSFRFCFTLFRFCCVSFRFSLFCFVSFRFRFLFYIHSFGKHQKLNTPKLNIHILTENRLNILTPKYPNLRYLTIFMHLRSGLLRGVPLLRLVFSLSKGCPYKRWSTVTEMYKPFLQTLVVVDVPVFVPLSIYYEQY